MMAIKQPSQKPRNVDLEYKWVSFITFNNIHLHDFLRLHSIKVYKIKKKHALLKGRTKNLP